MDDWYENSPPGVACPGLDTGSCPHRRPALRCGAVPTVDHTPHRRAGPLRLTGVTRYPRWGAEAGTPDMYNPHTTGNTPFSPLGAPAGVGVQRGYPHQPATPSAPYPVLPDSDPVPMARGTGAATPQTSHPLPTSHTPLPSCPPSSPPHSASCLRSLPG